MPAIPYTKTATSDGAWDAGANEKRLPAKKASLWAAHAWVDPDGDQDAKGSYKFPHHEVSSSGSVGAANLKACSAIIAALNGGRGGAKIPDKDRSGVHAHAAGHLKAAGKDAPDLKSLEQIDLEQRTGEVERRTTVGTVELRTEDGQATKIQGYAAVFNSETVIGGGMWGFREVILPGAFKEAIVKDDVRGLFNHDENLVLGRTKSGTLMLREDDHGLRYEIDPPDTSAARDVMSLITRGDVDGSSFAFTVPKDGDEWSYDEVKHGKLPLRTVKKVSLYDVSPVTYPAYPDTSVSARAKEKAMERANTQAAVRDDGGTGGGSTGDVGGDVGGMQASKAAIQKAIRKVASAKKAVRAMIKALDISHGFNPASAGLTGAGGAQLDTGGGRKKLTHKQRKALRKQARARRDAGDSGMSAASASMYYVARSANHAMLGAQKSMHAIRTICRDAGIDVGAADGSMGSDAGSGGANAARIDADLRAQEVELERLRG